MKATLRLYLLSSVQEYILGSKKAVQGMNLVEKILVQIMREGGSKASKGLQDFW